MIRPTTTDSDLSVSLCQRLLTSFSEGVRQ